MNVLEKLKLILKAKHSINSLISEWGEEWGSNPQTPEEVNNARKRFDMKMRKRKTKRNSIEDDFGGKPPLQFHDIDYMLCADYMPALPDAQAEVHMLIYLKSDPNMPIIMRFKSPDTLGDWISELTRYRKKVFPDAEPIDTEDTHE